MKNILELKNVSKRFPGVLALDDVSFDIREGEVHALVGENGAGKSTLIKILTGAYTPTSGQIIYNGEPLKRNSPILSKEIGISAIYQEFNLMPTLTVSENIFFGKEIEKAGFIKRKEMRRRAQELIKSIGVDIDANTLARNLSVAQQQIVEICKSLASNLKILIMDEPTAPLTQKEIDILFGIVKKLVSEKVTIIYISHRLEEIFEIADRVTVLRDGKFIDTANVSDTNREELIRKMVGREVSFVGYQSHSPTQEEVLRIENFSNRRVHNASFSVKKGEILGIAGMVGSGRTELLRAVFGADPVQSGKLWVYGKQIKFRSPKDATDNGIGFVTEDRKRQGLFLGKDIEFNVSFPNMTRIMGKLFTSRKKEKALAENASKDLNVKAFSVNQISRNLSGGNQQKLVLAKWLAKECKILLIDEPTRGIDVGAKQEIYKILQGLAENGTAVVVVSSEMVELINICNRVLVMRDGMLITELSGEDLTQENIMRYAILK